MAGYSGYQCQIGKYVSIYCIYELSTSNVKTVVFPISGRHISTRFSLLVILFGNRFLHFILPFLSEILRSGSGRSVFPQSTV